MRRRQVKLVGLLAVLGMIGLAAANPPQDAETKSQVPELVAFHEIIYPIWHTAYPNKDYQALRKYVPQINALAARLYAASLPGILRDKKAKWADGIALLKKAVEDYNAAADGNDDRALLDAAETLHAKFEDLARVIIPVIPEVHAFHQVLYVVYHKYAPERAYDKVRAVSPDLVSKAEAVVAARLPAEMSKTKDAFEMAAAGLLEAVKALDRAATSGDHSGIDGAIETVHARYQALEKIFENVRIRI